MRKVLSMALTLALLLAGCTSAMPSTENSDTTGTTEYVPVTVPTVSLPAVPEGEELQKLEELWREQLKHELVWYDPTSDYNLWGARNYGTYEGYTVIFEFKKDTFVTEWGVDITIAEHTFWHNRAFSLMACGSGEIVPLETIYNEGKIDKACIEQCYEIHKWYQELTFREYIGPIFEAAFGREPVWCDADIRNGIRYYGLDQSYGDALFIPDPDGKTELTVGEVSFCAQVPFEIYIYAGEFIKLEDYYKDRPDETLKQFAYVHEEFEKMLMKEKS